MSFTPLADAANISVNLSLFLELTSRERGYGRSWVTLSLSRVAELCSAMHSCHIDDVQSVVGFRHSLWVRTAHAALGFEKPIHVGLVHLNLEPDEVTAIWVF